MSTTQELITFVRDITDLDEADLPSSLVVSYLKDGFQRIINLERRWPFLETTYTLSTVAGQRDYAVSSIGAETFTEGTVPPKTAFREVTSVLDNSTSGNRLSLIAIDEAEAVWHGSFDTPTRPLFYAEWGDVIKLYPKPDTVYPLTVRGYRKTSYTWTTNLNLQVDCDERLHNAIAYYAVAQAYKRQEDPELSNVYKQSFDEAVMLARKELMRANGHRPMVMSRGFVRPSEKYWLESLGRTLGQ
jgi:hypothetical protein